MIKIKGQEITIQNFLSIGKKVTYEFKDGLTAIAGINYDKNGDGNGCGKSTLLEAVYFAYYGNTMRALKKEEIVNNIAKKNCEVTRKFQIEENGVVTDYRIERGIAPSFCRLFKNDIDITASGIPATNAAIVELLKTSEVMFRNTVMMSLNNLIPFMCQRKNEKRDFVEGIFDLSYINDMNAIARKRNSEAVAEYNKLETELTGFKANLETYKIRKHDADIRKEEQCKSLEESVNVQEKNMPKRIEDNESEIISGKISKLSSEIEGLTTQLDIANEDLTTITVEFKSNRSKKDTVIQAKETWDSELSKSAELLEMPVENVMLLLSSGDTTSYDQKLDSITTKLNDLSHQCSELSGSNASINAQVSELRKFGNICLACNRPYDTDDVEERDRKIAELEAKLKENMDQISSKKGVDQKLKVIRKKLTLEKGVIDKLNRAKPVDSESVLLECSKNENLLIEQGKTVKKLVNSISEQINKLRDDMATERAKLIAVQENALVYSNAVKNLEQLRNTLKGIREAKNDFDELIVSTQEQLDASFANVETASEKVKLYTVIRQVLADDGYRANVLHKMITTLNKQINYYLELLDANCTIQFDKFFDDTIIDMQQGEPRSYDSFSGGEKRRIDLAVLFAFMDMRRLQGEVEFDATFFDEVLDSALSADGSAKLFEILAMRKTLYGENANIVTHKKENLQNPLVQNRVIMKKLGGVSTIVEELVE